MNGWLAMLGVAMGTAHHEQQDFNPERESKKLNEQKRRKK
jgi:hypothetical protein